MTPEIIIRSFSDDQYTLDKIFYSNYYRIKNFEEEGSVVIDVGAHCGYFSILCAMRGAKKIYNVEPFIENYRVLLKNTDSFTEKVENLKLGVYTEYKLAKLAYPNFENNFFFFSRVGFDSSAELFDLNSFVTLDTLIEATSETKITLLKINIGYAEVDILKSSTHIDKCEYVCGEIKGGEEKMTSLTEYMTSRGFKDSFFAKTSKEEDVNVFIFAKDKCEELFEFTPPNETESDAKE